MIIRCDAHASVEQNSWPVILICAIEEEEEVICVNVGMCVSARALFPGMHITYLYRFG